MFQSDLQASVNKITPSTQERYTQAACLAIDFSNSDIPAVRPLRNELLDLLRNLYNWEVQTYTIDARKQYHQAERDLQQTAQNFASRYGQPQTGKALLVYYYSGHGLQLKSNPRALQIW